MSGVEMWLFLLSDTLLDVLILPPHQAYVWKAMLGFGNYAVSQVWLFASLGAICGTVLNWSIGRVLLACRRHEVIILESPMADRLSVWFQKYGKWLLLLCWVPVLGVVLTLAAGFLTVRFLPMLLLVSLVNFLLFYYLIFV